MKPREWWIEFNGDPRDDKENYKRYVGAEKFDPTGFNSECIHVVEYAAFELLRNKARDFLAQCFDQGTMLPGEVDSLAEMVSLEKCVCGEINARNCPIHQSSKGDE